jgi:hypothetical protein
MMTNVDTYETHQNYMNHQVQNSTFFDTPTLDLQNVESAEKKIEEINNQYQLFNISPNEQSNQKDLVNRTVG